MKINFEITEAEDGKFADVRLCYIDSENQLRKVKLNIDFLPLYDFTRDTSSVRFDFFFISALVYGVDNLVSRELYSVDGWAREIKVIFPVKNIDAWNGNENLLESTLKFLTGDYWKISFESITVSNMFVEKKGRWQKKIPQYEKKSIRMNSLFSGGLDSLIGVINCLETLSGEDKILLASHFDSNSAGPSSDQTALQKILLAEYPGKLYWIQSTITLDREDTNGIALKLEDSYRSRSFLFIGIGLYLLTPEIKTNELTIPENGTISLNYPLTPSRVSSLSTRTTHPYVLSLLQSLVLRVIGAGILKNPYSFKTKGEMAAECLNQLVLGKTYLDSVSCGKRGRRNHWIIKSGTEHCGVCMPCIYRRAALHKNALDGQLYGIDLLNMHSVNYDMPALFDYLKSNLTIEKIKRDLLVNGSLPFDKLEDYAKVIVRSRTELLKWLSVKGNVFIKNNLGLK